MYHPISWVALGLASQLHTAEQGTRSASLMDLGADQGNGKTGKHSRLQSVFGCKNCVWLHQIRMIPYDYASKKNNFRWPNLQIKCPAKALAVGFRHFLHRPKSWQEGISSINHFSPWETLSRLWRAIWNTQIETLKSRDTKPSRLWKEVMLSSSLNFCPLRATGCSQNKSLGPLRLRNRLLRPMGKKSSKSQTALPLNHKCTKNAPSP